LCFEHGQGQNSERKSTTKKFVNYVQINCSVFPNNVYALKFAFILHIKGAENGAGEGLGSICVAKRKGHLITD